MMLHNYEILILLFGLIAFNVSNVVQPFFARRYSVKLVPNKKSITLLLASICTVVMAFALFFTQAYQVSLYLLLIAFCVFSFMSWKNTIEIVRATKQVRWGLSR